VRSEAGSLWSLAAGLVSDFPLSKQKILSPNSSLKKKGREVEDVRILLWCVSTHRFSPAFCEWRVQFRWVFFLLEEDDAGSREMQQAKQASWERATSSCGRVSEGVGHKARMGIG
jgi:hypothetical protein